MVADVADSHVDSDFPVSQRPGLNRHKPSARLAPARSPLFPRSSLSGAGFCSPTSYPPKSFKAVFSRCPSLASPGRFDVVPSLRHRRPSPWANTESGRITVAECLGCRIWITANLRCSPASRRVYEYSIDRFIAWYCPEPRLAFNHTKPPTRAC
jgi:hypothetical protein